MEKIIYEKVGQRLKQARELKQITLEEAGNKIGVHKSTILRWENGETEKFKISMLEALANLYDVNPAWLMGYDVPMKDDLNSQKSNNFRMASYNGVDTEGLNEQDIEEINRFVEFLKQKKKDK